MTKLRLTKMHGTGNDFVLLDGIDASLPDLSSVAAHICHRRFGVGCDQLLVLLPSGSADFRMRIYNADGSEIEMCGNGLRCLYRYVRSRGYTLRAEITVETDGGIVRAREDGELVRIDMGEPRFDPAQIPTLIPPPAESPGGPILMAPLEIEGTIYKVSVVSRIFPVANVGSRIERHPSFPQRVNVEFVAPENRTRIVQRTWERGTGETMACGSGACATAVACALNGLTEREVDVWLPGGNLHIHWDETSNHVYMSGPAEEVFTGEIDL
jgi:diaminopimelate epimerase